MVDELVAKISTWRTAGGDMSDAEWELIADLFAPYWKPGLIGRPVKHDRRRIVDAIFYVVTTGCQWRHLPSCYPNWSTVHAYHVRWSRNGTWEKASTRLREAVRIREGRDPEPSGGIIDARSVRGAATVTRHNLRTGELTRGYDAGKKISGRKVFGLVDTLGWLIGVRVLPASVSDNAGGIAVFNAGRVHTSRLGKVWVDAGFKKKFVEWCRTHHVTAEVVNRIHPHEFVVLPRRWVVERTWSWLMNHRRLQVDYERDPKVTEGFVWAAHTRHQLRRLTTS